MFINEKDLKGLKKAFVWERFREDEYFKRSDIEDWLQAQRKADRPEYIDRRFGKNKDYPGEWNFLLPLLHKQGFTGYFAEKGESNGNILKEMGFPIRQAEFYPALEDATGFSTSDLDFHCSIFGLAAKGYVSDSCLLFVLKKGNQKLLRVQPASISFGGTYSTRFLQQHVAGSVLLSWMFLDDKKREKAREKLCNWLERIIAVARKQAEEEFDRAVAVSADGKKITNAYFVIHYDDSTMKLYVQPETAAWNKKLIRSPDLMRHTAPVEVREITPESVAGGLVRNLKQWGGEETPNQHLFTFQDKKNKRLCLLVINKPSVPMSALSFEAKNFALWNALINNL